MNRIILILVFVSFFNLESNSQFSIPIQPWAKNIENRILIVKLKDENPKKIKKLRKEGKLAIENYRNSISEQNDKLKELIPKYWPFNNKIEFRKTSEVKDIVENKDMRYLILDYRYTDEIRQSATVYHLISVYALLVYYPEYAKKLTKSYLLDDNGNGTSRLKRGQYIFKVSFPQPFLNDRDLKFAFYQFKEFIERAKTEGWTKKINRFGFKIAYVKPENAKLLKEKTLLIPKELVSVDENIIKDEYKYSYKIVPIAQIDSLLNNDINNEYAYYNIIWSDKGRYWTLIIIDNKTGKILAENPTTDRKFLIRIAARTGEHSMATIFKTADIDFVINEKHIKNLMNLIN